MFEYMTVQEAAKKVGTVRAADSETLCGKQN